MTKALAALAVAIGLAPCAVAQVTADGTEEHSAARDVSSPPHWLYGSLGYSIQGAKGFEFALGFQADWNRLIYVRASPLNLVLTQADGFYRDQFSNGQSRCRDESNGQFASDGACNGLDYRVDADAYIRFGSVSIGGGVIHTISSDYTPEREGSTDPFIAMMFEGGEHWGAELRAGKDNAALRLRGSF